MNLIDVETHVDQGTRHWSAVWQAGTENEGFALGDRNYIIALAARWGMQPVNLKTFVESGQRYWFGVYRDTGIERETRYDLTWSGVRAAFHEPGRRILHLEPYMDFSARRWAAIIEHRKNDAVLTWWPNAWQFTKEVQRMMDQYGYRPYDFAVCRGWD